MIHNHQNLVNFYDGVPTSTMYLLLKGLNASENLILELIHAVKFSQSYTSAVKVFIQRRNIFKSALNKNVTFLIGLEHQS